MKRFLEVFPGIYQVGGAELSSPDDCCIYLLDGGGESVLIDCGVGRSTRQILENIAASGVDAEAIKYIIATHGHIDHIGGLHFFKSSLQARVIAHELELPAIAEGRPNLTAAQWYGVDYQPVEVDRVLTATETTLKIGSLELHCLHTPGHTPGGISVYLDKEGQRILFGQDIHGPFNPAWGSDMDSWRKSMHRLLDLQADILCEGHFGIYKPALAVKKYIDKYLANY